MKPDYVIIQMNMIIILLYTFSVIMGFAAKLEHSTNGQSYASKKDTQISSQTVYLPNSISSGAVNDHQFDYLREIIKEVQANTIWSDVYVFYCKHLQHGRLKITEYRIDQQYQESRSLDQDINQHPLYQQWQQFIYQTDNQRYISPHPASIGHAIDYLSQNSRMSYLDEEYQNYLSEDDISDYYQHPLLGQHRERMREHLPYNTNHRIMPYDYRQSISYSQSQISEIYAIQNNEVCLIQVDLRQINRQQNERLPIIIELQMNRYSQNQ